ncbi:MAG: hypothetical protein KFB93_03520 [Simkaniaceae bacterium]|nr:MAG: hypothetical protein KFB93_03520 [Simkaniaceae bacterium]
MKRFIPLIFLLVNTAFASPHVTEDFFKGKDLSEGHHLPMALVFTGSDWSESSKELIAEVFEENLSSEIVLVKVDFPELNTQSKEILSQNHELKEKFHVETFPMVILLDEEQNEITRLGYPIQGVSDFGHYLKEMGRRYFLLQKRFEEAKRKKNKGELKVCFIEAKEMGATTLSEAILNFGFKDSPELMLEKYITIMGTEEGKELRKTLMAMENKEIQTRLALLEFQESESSEPLEHYIAKFGEASGDHCWKIHMVLSEYLMEQEKKEEALEHAQVSYRHAPPEERETISGLISKMLPLGYP